VRSVLERYDLLAPRGLLILSNFTNVPRKILGINTVLLSSGWITASSARMNDHFFADGSDVNKRQYTMCHEVSILCWNEFYL
jgi:hypothetical protein